MIVDPTDEQEFFRQTTERFLAERAPVAVLRQLRADTLGFDPRYWRDGAGLGWTSLLAPDFGGGSLTDAGVVDLTLIAGEFGAHAAPGPLACTNLAAAALNDAGSHGEVLADVVAGEAIVSWCGVSFGQDGTPATSVDLRIDGSDIIVNGVASPVESADPATHLLVTAMGHGGLSQLLVPTASAGIEMMPLKSIDLTRRFWRVRFDNVRVPSDALIGENGQATSAVERQIQLGFVIASAEMVGAMQTAFDMTVEWAFDRFSFGRPLASYQALKHRFADMKSWLEASHAIADAAAAATDSSDPDAAELASAAMSFIGDYGSELLQDCVQMHGGIGLTFEHDMHLFLRRHTLNRGLHGTSAQHRQRLASLATA
jgi:alkylation response protein AidB-like acyl-CoA dehydrogenase